MNPYGAIIGGAAGLLKNLTDPTRESRERQLAASTQRFSPWTGMQAQEVKPTNWFGDILQGAAAGAGMGQGGGGMSSKGFMSGSGGGGS